MIRKKSVLCIALAGALCLTATGCGSKSQYTDEQENMIADYAAEAVLKHDKIYQYNYINNISNEQKEVTTTLLHTVTEEETTAAATGDGTTGDISQDMSDGTEVSGDSYDNYEVSSSADIKTAFEAPDGINIDYVGYEIDDVYPTNADDSTFIIKAVDGYSLMVIKFNVTNTTNQDISVNFMENEKKYKGVVGGAKKYNAQLTLLQDALNTYEGTIAAGSSQQMVLIYQTQIGSADEVKSLAVTVTSNASENKTVYLK